MQLLPKPQKNYSCSEDLASPRSPEPPLIKHSSALFHENAPISFSTRSNTSNYRTSNDDRSNYSTSDFGAGSNPASLQTYHQRVVLLVDGSSLFYAASYLHIDIDYVKLLHYLTHNRRLVRAYFYTGVDRTNEKQQGFLHWMRRNGYRVVDKDLIQFPDGSKKANVEVEIAVDMMTLADHCDAIVLLSGDGNLAYAVNATAYRGVQVEVVSLRSMTSDSLINVADSYIDLGAIKEAIQRL
jgi:uncharacterized LabA/DUF88 family protein